MTDSIRADIVFGEPQSEDAFSAGGHDRSARALADSLDKIIKHGQASGKYGGAIGLEGNWGSGKTTVIQIAEGKLEKLSGGVDFKVMTFDMWAHQSDEFRRAFLEEFLNFIEKRGSFEADGKKVVDVEVERNAIRNRKKHVTDAVQRNYTFIGAIVVLMLPFLPLLYSWLQPASFANRSKLGWAPQASIAIGVMIVVAAVIGYLVSYFGVDGKERAKIKTVREKFALGVSRLLTISKNVKDQTTTQWIRDEDPTTVEFQEVFRGLLAKVQGGNRRIVFVLDNVDRLPAEMVQKAWSDMRALFAARASKPEETVLAVIPYDRYHVSQGLGSKGSVKDTSIDEKAPKKVKPPEHDLFEKTFDRIIRVSPPVPSDWRKYLNDRLDQAFGETVGSESREKLYRLLRHWFVETDLHPTPRRIVSFVNDVSALLGQWGDVIPAESIGLYVLHREQVDRNHGALAQVDVVGDRFISIAGQKDWRQHLAALSFNVELDYANQVFLGQPIAAALTAADPKSLVEMSEIRGFWEIFQEQLTEGMIEWTDSKNAVSLARAAINVAELKLAEDRKRSVWSDFASRLRLLPALDYASANELEGLVKIVQMQPGSEAIALADTLRAKYEATPLPEELVDQQDMGNRWVRMLYQLREAVVAAADEQSAQKFWTGASIEAAPDFVLGVAGASLQDDLDFGSLGIQVEPEGLAEAMALQIDPDPHFYSQILPLLYGHLGSVPQSHVDNIVAKLQATGAENSEHAAVLSAAAFLNVHDSKIVKAAFTAIAKDGTFAWHAMKNEDEQARAYAFFFSVIFGPAPLGTIRGNQNADLVAWYSGIFAGDELDEEMRAGVAEVISENAAFQQWLDLSMTDPSTHENLKDIVRRVVDTGKAPIIDSMAFFQTLGKVVDLLGVAGTFKVLAAAPNTAAQLETAAFEYALQIPPELLQVLAANANERTIAPVLKGIDARLEAATTEQWTEYLSNPSTDEYKLLASRVRHGGIKLPAAKFVPAVASAAINLLTGQFVAPSDYDSVLDAVPPRSIPQVASMVLTKLSTADVTQAGVEGFVARLAPLAAKLKIDENQGVANVAVRKLIWFLVNSTEDASKRFVRDNAVMIRKSLELADGDVGIEEIVDDMESDGEWPNELRKLLKMPKKKE
jgi:uncharacterized membrane protein YwzB